MDFESWKPSDVKDMSEDERQIMFRIMGAVAKNLREMDNGNRRSMIFSIMVSLTMTVAANEGLSRKQTKELCKLLYKVTKRGLDDLENDPNSVKTISLKQVAQ